MLPPPLDLLPPVGPDDDSNYMREALLEALEAWKKDEVPVGAVMVHGGEIIARSHNTREATQDPTDHAEITAIRRAAEVLGSWRLEETTLYVTLEPCIMCSGAILQARIPRVVWGASDPKGGGACSLYELLEDERLNHRCDTLGEVHREACSSILTRYFRAKRA